MMINLNYNLFLLQKLSLLEIQLKKILINSLLEIIQYWNPGHLTSHLWLYHLIQPRGTLNFCSCFKVGWLGEEVMASKWEIGEGNAQDHWLHQGVSQHKRKFRWGWNWRRVRGGSKANEECLVHKVLGIYIHTHTKYVTQF